MINLAKLLLFFWIGIPFFSRGEQRLAYPALNENVKVDVKNCLDGAPEEKWRIKDISDWYDKWLLPNERLVKITRRDPPVKTVVVHFDGKGKGIILNGSEGIPRLSSILSRRLKKFPSDAKERLLLMRRITELRFNPVYNVGSKELLKIHRDGIDDWLRGSVKSELVFKKYCRNPIFDLNREDNKWKAEFFIFNWDGGVDKATASGKIEPFSLETIASELELEVGSFSWPYF